MTLRYEGLNVIDDGKAPEPRTREEAIADLRSHPKRKLVLYERVMRYLGLWRNV